MSTSKRMTALTFLGCLLCGTSSSAQSFPAYRVVVHSSSPVSSMTKAQVSELFLKKTTQWDQGGEVLPVDQSKKSSVREVFSQEVHGKPVRVIRSYWQTQLFAGIATPPPELASDDEVLSFVRDNAGAIGYVSKSVVVGDGVKPVDLTN